MNHQEIFDRVATHLFKQGKQAIDFDNSCVYRGPDDTKCAIGCLIPDEVYTDEMECHTINALLYDFPYMKEVLAVESYEDQLLLRDLQRCHDNIDHWRSTPAMKILLRETAQKFKLDYSVLDTVWFDDR